jgi:hypothetical protein
MEGDCSTGQSPQWALVPMEEEKEEAEIFVRNFARIKFGGAYGKWVIVKRSETVSGHP